MKINKKSIVALAMIFVMLFSLIACGGNPDLKLASDGKTEYVIVRSEDASGTVASSAIKLRNAFNRVTGAEITIVSDAEEANAAADAKEIIIGSTNRTLVNPVTVLKEKDYSIYADGKRLVFVGGSDQAISSAVAYFIDNILTEDNKNIVLESNYAYDLRNTYEVDTVKIGPDNIGIYTIVIPTDANPYELHTAEFLREHIYNTVGFNIKVIKDDTAETAHEILIGATNRTASVQAAEKTLGETQYILSIIDKKLVISGNGYMVAGGVGELINKHIVAGAENATVELSFNSDYTPSTIEFTEAKSVILMIGDGMGYNQIKITEQAGMGRFSASMLPHRGSATTNSLSGVTDSAAAGTALATGYKTYNSYLGMDKERNIIENIREVAQKTGAMTGIMTSENIHGATPGAFLVHHHSRNDADIIKAQIAELDVDYLGSRVGDNMLRDFKACLAKFTDANKHFFVMLEESDIDPAGHANDHEAVIKAVKRFNESIIYAMVFTVINPDTVLIVTADHETGGLIESPDGTFKFTTGGHSSAPVPVYAIGKGTEIFNDKTVDNIEIAKFMATVYGRNEFGQ